MGRMAKHKTHQKSGPATGGKDKKTSKSGPSGGDSWLFGRHVVLAALANPARTCRRLVLAAQGGADLEAEVEAAIKAGASALRPEIRDSRELEALLPRGAVHQGMALLADAPTDMGLGALIETTENAENALILVLDRVSDPRNLGAVLRSAAAFGADGVIVTDRHAPELTGTAAKAASGAVEVVPLVRVANLGQALGTLKDVGFWCYGLDGHASEGLGSAKLGGKTALVMGAEGEGLRRLTRESCDALYRIPIVEGPVESLNMAAAATVALYEAAKQRS